MGFEVLRYAGAAYLAFLALKALRSAWVGGAAPAPAAQRQSRLFVKGLALHLTNPKAIVSWAAVYTVALPPDSTVTALWSVFGALICVSMVVFFGYALLFSSERIAQGYAKARRVFEAVFGGMFGAAAVKIFTAKLPVQQ